MAEQTLYNSNVGFLDRNHDLKTSIICDLEDSKNFNMCIATSGVHLSGRHWISNRSYNFFHTCPELRDDAEGETMTSSVGMCEWGKQKLRAFLPSVCRVELTVSGLAAILAEIHEVKAKHVEYSNLVWSWPPWWDFLTNLLMPDQWNQVSLSVMEFS
jgi:hypothetical protein